MDLLSILKYIPLLPKVYDHFYYIDNCLENACKDTFNATSYIVDSLVGQNVRDYMNACIDSNKKIDITLLQSYLLNNWNNKKLLLSPNEAESIYKLSANEIKPVIEDLARSIEIQLATISQKYATILHYPESRASTTNALSIDKVVIESTPFESLLNQSIKFIDELNPAQAKTYLETIKKDVLAANDKRLSFRFYTIYSKAQQLLGLGEDAIESIDWAYNFQPDNVIANINKAKCCFLKHDYGKALQYTEIALSKEPENVPANLLALKLKHIKTNNFHELDFSAVPKSVLDSDEFNFEIAITAANAKQYKTSLEYLEKLHADNNPLLSFEAEVLKAEVILASIIEDDYHKNMTVVPHSINGLNQVIDLYNPLIEKIKNNFIEKQYASLYTNRGIAYLSLGNIEMATNDFIKALNLDPEDNLYKRNLGLAYSLDYKYDEAIEIFKKIPDYNKCLDVSFLLAQTLRNKGNYTEAIDVIKDHINNQGIHLENAEELLIQLYTLSQDINSAKEYALEKHEENPANILRLINLINVLRSTDNPDSIEHYIGQLITLTETASDIEKYSIANLFFSIKNYANFISVYESIRHEPIKIDLFIMYVESLLETGQGNKSIELIEKALTQKNNPHQEKLLKILLDIYYKVSDYAKAIPICQQLLSLNKADNRTRLYLCNVYYRLEEMDKLQEVLNSYDYTHLEYSENQNYVFFLLETRQLLEALNYSYQLLENNYNQPEYHNFYTSVFLHILSLDSSIIPEPNTANIDSVVISSNPENGEAIYLLTDKPDPDIKNHEINSGNPIFNSLINKSVSDTYTLAGINNTTYTINKIISKYGYAYLRSEEYLKKIFPDKNNIISQSLDETRLDWGIPSIFTILSQRNKNLNEILKTYKKMPIPIKALPSIMGSTLLDIYESLTSCPVGFKCSTGIQPLEDIKDSAIIVLDITAILTINSLDLYKNLSNRFKKIIVAQKTIEFIKDEIRTLSIRPNSSIGLDDFGGFRPCVTDNSIKLSQYQKILIWIKTNCSIEITYKSLDYPPKEYDPLFEMLGSSLDSILHCQNGGFIFYCDDYACRKFAEDSYQVQTIWIESLLIDLHKRKMITTADYFNYLIKLVQLNYYSIINLNDPSLLLFAANQENGSFFAIVDKLTSDESYNFPKVLTTVLVYLHQSISLQIPVKYTSNTMYILNELSKTHDAHFIGEWLMRLIKKSEVYGQIEKFELTQIINKWLQVRELNL